MVGAANAITALRFVAAPALLWLGWTGRPVAFLVVLGLAFLSDVVDGPVARQLGETSEHGARLDTAGDLAVFVTVPVAGWWLWPERVRPEAPFLVVLAVSYAAPIVVGLAKYGRLTNHHTWAGKLSGWLLGLSGAAFIVGASPWWLRAAIAVVVVADLEEIAITLFAAPQPTGVPTLWHAMRQTRSGVGKR
ncbi:MAG TPA: CDP-alcohol phosphatidyltransferase family protein [Candidatus Binatia bacterium]|nr:CDP-alcohol phosphatidyltransferase family protein [Candidatus Binatia bacterium]